LTKFVYVANKGSNTVSGYSITATTGVLTPIAGSPFAAGSSPTSLAIVN
jgi:6-phosphogluconolactonase